MSVVSNIEQWLLELTNRARLDPEAMASAFGIDLNDGLPPGTISAAAKQPLAMSGILLETADFHTAWVLENNSFGTVGHLGSNPGDRMAYAGFNGGAGFDWAENIGWRDFGPTVSIHETTMAYNIWRDLFLDPSARAALLDENLNETGISAMRGPIADLARHAYVMTQDMGDSDDVFITGAAYRSSFFEVDLLILPEGIGGIEMSGQSGATITNEAGGYRLAVEAGRQQVRLGDIRALVTVGDENIKLDLIGVDALRSSHSATILSGARYAELIGVSDAGLKAGQGAGAIGLYGNKGNNRLVGNGSDNLLDGRAGNDIMQGGAGDDRYTVDSTGDRVIERAGEGYDRIFTTASFRLAANSEVEHIEATHSIFWDPIDLTGNRFAQELRGNYGDNRLDGGGGGDILAGYEGNDLYIIRNSADQIVDWADGGNDRLKATVSFALAADDEIEWMETINAASTTAISLTGNDFGQTLLGNAGRNTLSGLGGDDVIKGGAGNDVLVGGLGADMLYGGVGGDRFVFESANDSPVGVDRDTIFDWEAIDRIDLSAFDTDPVADGLQGLSFVGEIAKGEALGGGQVAYYHSGGSTFVIANTDADAAADFQVRLAGIHDLVLNDFVLV